MQWIKYQIVCGKNESEEDILLNKKVGYSAENLAIAQKEAYDGYEIFEDEQFFDNEPLPVKLGGTGASNVEDALKNLGLDELSKSVTKLEIGSYVGTGTSGSKNPTIISTPFPAKAIIITCSSSNVGYERLNYGIAIMIRPDSALSLFYNPAGAVNYGKSKIKWEDDKVSWYFSTKSSGESLPDENYQLNSASATYNYILLG